MRGSRYSYRFVAGCHRDSRAVLLYPLEITIDLFLLQLIYTFILKWPSLLVRSSY